MSKDLDFVCGAVFSGEDGSADVLGVPFDTTAREDASAKLQEQWNKFSTLNSVPYDGRYKADDDERLTISNYGDMDGVGSSSKPPSLNDGGADLFKRVTFDQVLKSVESSRER